MTPGQALKEAQRRWDAAKPTAWRAAGRPNYSGAQVRRVVTEIAWHGPPLRRQTVCEVGFMESWPGSCMGFQVLGRGKTFEAAFAEVDAKAERRKESPAWPNPTS